MRFQRCLKNELIDTSTYYRPYIQTLLANLPEGPLVVIMDASLLGRGCIALLVSVLYQKRALPLYWSVVKGKKGHLPKQAHIALLEQATQIVGKDPTVIFLGAGEFGGIDLLGSLAKLGWHFVCRTSKNTVFFEDVFFTRRFQIETFFPIRRAVVSSWRTAICRILCVWSG